jgi:molybdate transport system substrate-binding protein
VNIRRQSALTLFAIAALGLSGCGSATPTSSSSATTSSKAATGTITVDAAASLNNAFTDIAARFEKQNPDADVVLSFDGSATLATQINQGAPVDVFASADEKNMTKIGDLATAPKPFATNTLVIITAPDNPKKIKSLKDLTAAGVSVAQCAAEQPCGASSLAAESEAGVTITPATLETSVTGVATKVTTGQVDAGLVYVTNATALKGKVHTVNDPAFKTVVNEYPITQVSTASNPSGAKAFVTFVLGTEGQKILRSYGFAKP